MNASSCILSTHGIGAILTSDTSFNKTYNHGIANYTVSQSANSTKGWIYFTIPSPPPGYTTLEGASVNFTQDNGVTVTMIQAYQGASPLLNYPITGSQTEPVKPNTTYNFTSPTEYNGNGIVVAIYVEFTISPATLSIVSVGVTSSSK